MAKKPEMQVHVQSSSFKELLEVQKGAAKSLMTMTSLMEKMNKLSDTQLKQKTRLKDLQSDEIKHLQKRNELSAAEAKAIANLVGQMKTFPSLFERLQDKTKGLTNFFKNPMAGIRTGMLKATNVFGINDRRLEREKFISAQKALGVNKSFGEHADDFAKAQAAGKDIKKNEAKIAELKKSTGMSEKQLAGTEAGKSLFATRKTLTDEYAKHDVRAAGIKSADDKATPTQKFADQSTDEERNNENDKARDKQIELLEKIETNTRGDSPDQKAKPKVDEGKGGLLSGLLGGGKMANVLKSMKDFGIGLVFVAGGLWVASKAFKSFAEVKWEDIGKGLLVLTGLIAVTKLLGNSMKEMFKASVGIVALSAALWVAGKSISSFADLDWETMGKAAVTLTGLGVAGLLLGKIMPEMIKGGIGLAAMGAGLWVVTEALKGMQEIGWETMGKAAVAIIGLGAASLVLGPAAPLMIAAGVGLAAMGAGLWVVGEALQAIGKGFDDMIAGIERLSVIDGDNLWNVAKGLGAVSAAMIAFAGANVLTGITNLVTKLLSFGQDSPLEQLQKIASYGDGINKAGSGMQRLAAGMKGFSDIKGDTLKETMKALNEFPWDKATKFVAAGGVMSADGARIYNQSKGNEDKRAANDSSKGGTTNTVVAPQTNVQSTTVQQMRPVIRNQETTQRRVSGLRYANDF